MKRTPLKRKIPLKSKGCGLKRTPLRKMSKGRSKEMREYAKASKVFLQKPENRFCHICICWKEDVHFDIVSNALLNPGGYFQTVVSQPGSGINPATEIHHRRGRNKGLLCDERFFCSSCKNCREVPHQNPIKARKLGLIASAKDWNTTQPKEENK